MSVNLPALEAHELNVLGRALQVYLTTLDELEETVEQVSMIPLRDNPVFLHVREQKAIVRSLATAVSEATFTLERQQEQT